MQGLLLEIEAAGGMSPGQKDLLDRQAYQDARDFLGQGAVAEQRCDELLVQLDAGEFDLDPAD